MEPIFMPEDDRELTLIKYDRERLNLEYCKRRVCGGCMFKGFCLEAVK